MHEIAQGDERHGWAWLAMIDCVRQLDPRCQLERGPAFFLYAGSILAVVAGVALLLAGRADAESVLLVSLVLWLSVLIGNLLVIVLGTEDVTEDPPQGSGQEPQVPPALPPGVAESLTRQMQERPRGWEDTDSVELPGGQNWQVPLKEKDHDDS